MPREPKAWYNKHTGLWCTDIAGVRHKLLRGKRGDERRKTTIKEATGALSRLLSECAANPTAEAGPEVQSVPGVIDEYLTTACEGNDVRTFADKNSLLTRFARRHRVKRAVDLIPVDLERWLRENQQWKSDDYRAKVCTTVHACFNWAASHGVLGKNARNTLRGPQAMPPTRRPAAANL
jgi:hypothetical protein